MPISLSRRQFFVGTAGAVAAAALGDGFLIEPVSIDVTRHDVPIPGLPHELDGGIDRATGEKAYGIAGVELLYNSTTRIRVGNASLTVVGIDDPVRGDPDVVAATRGLAGRAPCLWVLHAPGYVDTIHAGVVPRPAAVLSGHTHGGQVRLPFYTPFTPYGSGRFVAGWYRDTLAPLYVSRGIGTVGLPARLFCPPELPIFTLRTVDRKA